MVKALFSTKIQKLIIFAFLIVFPLGQLLRLDLSFLGSGVRLHPIDIIAGLTIPLVLLERKRLKLGFLSPFFIALTFSYLISLIIFGYNAFPGGLYLLRLISYFCLGLTVFVFAKSPKSKALVFTSLIGVTAFTAIFAWFQYFLYSNLGPFIEFGWDDHLFRLAGTFLDPNFLSIIMVFGILGTLSLYRKTAKKRLLLLILFFSVSLLFTYSRSGYLALFAGVSYLLFKESKRVLLYLATVFVFFMFLLPRPAGEGVRLERVASVFARVENYEEAIGVIREYPLFGVGYNNICLVREGDTLGKTGLLSHACSGFDASLLTLFATTGVVGVIAFLDLLKSMVEKTSKDIYGVTFKASGVALLTHSIFINSLFYPWVLGFILVLFGLSFKGSSEE